MASGTLTDEYISILGADLVNTDPAALAAAAQTNYPTSQKISLIVHPATTDQLSACLKLAARRQHAVYVVSRGKNWGYGSKVPVKDGCVLIELDRMNRILDYDEQLGYITVEPGVTFQQAFDFLREKNSTLLLGTTGGSTDSSIIGNVLERGIGTGLYADRFSYVCGMEVVLPDGSVIQTGFERFPNSATGKLSRWGMGPSLDGLFAQSNLGIVTRMTVWLLQSPEYFRICFYKIDSTEKLAGVIDVLQRMAMEGLARPALTLYNDLRVLSSVIQFPFNETQPGELDQDVLMEKIRAASPFGGMVGAWNGEITIRAVSEAHADIQSRLIEERLQGLVYEFTSVSVDRTQILDILKAHYTREKQEPPTLTSFLLHKYIGIPTNAAIGQMYWRKRKPAPAVMEPDKDRCGMLWFCPVIPFRGEDISKVVDILKRTAKKYALEAAISLQCLTERSIHIIASVNWDREVASEDEQAVACYQETHRLLEEAGYYAYRNATLEMPEAVAADDYDRLLVRLKQAIDPGNILSPGKYIPSL